MKILNKIIWVLAGLVFLTLVFFSAFGVFYFLEISKAKNPASVQNQTNNSNSLQNQNNTQRAFNSNTGAEQVSLNLTDEQKLALKAVGIDPAKLDEKQTQDCIVNSIGQDRMAKLMSGEVKPDMSDMLKFKACF